MPAVKQPAQKKGNDMSETPPEETDADQDDPQEPRLNPAGPDIDGDGDGDDTLVSEGDPPSTTD
jgi:hypothetical protein